MSRQAAVAELSDRELEQIMRAAQSVVDNDFVARKHLPAGIFKLLEPIATATCQGFYTTTMMMAWGNGCVDKRRISLHLEPKANTLDLLGLPIWKCSTRKEPPIRHR